MAKFKHYKGNFYEMVCIAIHSETEEKLVIYKNDENIIYARPYDLFYGVVEVNGEKVSRFAEIK